MVFNGILCHWYRFATLFIRTRYFWLSLSVLIVFPNISHICCYFIFVAIILFDLALHICILHICSGKFQGKIVYLNTQIRVYHLLFTDGTTDYVAAEDFDGTDLILL